MSGLYLLLIAVAWLAVVLTLAYASTLRIKTASLRAMAALILASVLLPLPLIDEILGERQFEKLCRENATIQVDRKKAVGKTVYFVPQPPIEIPGAWVRIVVKPQRYVDSTTGTTVISFNTLLAEGGQFVQKFRISEGRVPLMFRGSCGPTEDVRELLKALDITPQDSPK